jgi:hypothetical protein
MDSEGADREATRSEPQMATHRPWDVPELVAAGASLASVGLFLGFAVAGVDIGVQVHGFGPAVGTLGVTYGTSWVTYTVPLALSALLAAWWGQGRQSTNGRTTDAVGRRLRPILLAVASLAVPTAAAGLARLAYTVTTPSLGPTHVSSLAMSAGICVLAVGGAFTQLLAARRLLGAGPRGE